MFRARPSKSRRSEVAALALLLPLLAGCGSKGHSNPMAPVPPAQQSGSLVVVASVAADADSTGSMSTQFTVALADTGTGAAATGATVSFSTPSGVVNLVEDVSTPGTYRAQQNGHVPGTYNLSVARGLDVAAGSVDMPDQHAITSPAADDTVSTSGSLNVTWNRSAAAQEAWIDTKEWTTGSQTDTGSGKVPKGHNHANSDQSVGVTRRNSSAPASMAAGSMLRASVRVAVQPVIVQ
jgi:hypothetical protein